MIKSNRFESESFDKRREEKRKRDTARAYKGEEMRRREAIIDPARVKRKEARGISRAERRGEERARRMSKGWCPLRPLSQREVRRDSCTIRSASFSRLTRCQPRFHGLKGWTDGVGGAGNHKAKRRRRRMWKSARKTWRRREGVEKMAAGLAMRPGNVSVNLT